MRSAERDWLLCVSDTIRVRQSMGEVKKLDFDDDAAPILDQEDEATLAAIDRGIKAADEGCLVPLEEVRRQMEQWTTRSSSPKTR